MAQWQSTWRSGAKFGAILFLVMAGEAAAPHGDNAEGLTPLHVAAGKGEVGTIRALIEA